MRASHQGLPQTNSKKKKTKSRDTYSKSGEATIAVKCDVGEVFVVSTQRNIQEWVLDSGCTYHVCPIRDWFREYKVINGGEVLMGDNDAYKVIGIGNISIKITDGSINILSEVKHVPSLKKKLDFYQFSR